MNNELNLFAKLVLRESYGEFEKLLSEFEESDNAEFVRRHKAMFRKADFDPEDCDDIDELFLFQCFAIQAKRMFFVDWSGEEYPGQVKRSIGTMLQNYGEGKFKWDKKLEAVLDFSKIRRGDYLPLLLSVMDKQLAVSGYRIAIFDVHSDTFYYCLLPGGDMERVNGTQTESFNILDTKIYAVYLTDKGTESGKMLLWLKNKFSVPLNEIKAFAAQPEILLAKGNLVTAKAEKAEAEKIGGTVRIEEIG